MRLDFLRRKKSAQEVMRVKPGCLVEQRDNFRFFGSCRDRA